MKPADTVQAFVLVGATATGKSSVAHRLARRMNALLLSADSMNLYCGMDIGTAKPSAQQRQEVDYAGVDLVEPETSFSVADYLRAVGPALRCAAAEDRPVVVAGGTGLYVKCLLQGLGEAPPADPELRRRLEGCKVSELQAELHRRAPERLAALADPENPRRLIRALEQAVQKTPAPENWKNRPVQSAAGLDVSRKVLHERIARRVEQMYADGLLEEARGLMERRLSNTARQAIGYAEAFAVLRGEISRERAVEKTVVRTRQLAKRQRTWFNNQLKVHWVCRNLPAGGWLDAEAAACETARIWEQIGPCTVRCVE